ncbi:hypothetical protein FRY74_01100 [Vicingus serpentipes]|uniref:Uncharacterized protein n=1 Tax=Vicingus serpentipes TaxID=1926625 RepID=A0A5C6RWY2_9FLAO|nr:DUF6056 family protein [Vicingus serpentipes]TXB66811.1 hypothetical protein FRY74_01100 [Vicingus serpentipes]
MKLKATSLIALQGVLFIIFLIITSGFNRLAADDFYYIGELSTKSVSEVYQHLYFKWHGRWTSNFSQVISFKFYEFPFFLFFANLISFSFLFLSTYSLAANLKKRFVLNLNKNELIVYTFVFLSVFFFCCVSPSSSWFWHTSAVVYLWSVTAFIYLFALFIKPSTSILEYVLLVLSSIYLGGSNEPLALFSLVFLSYHFYQTKKATTILSFSLILIAFLINYFSSGTTFRDGITPSLSFGNLIVYTGYGTLKFFLFSSYKTFIPALLLASPFYLLGQKQSAEKSFFNPKKELLFSFLFIIFFAILNQLLVIYALGGLAPDRSTTASSILIALVIVRYLYLLGKHHKPNYLKLKLIIIFNCIGLFVFTSITSYYHFNYAKAYDERMEGIANSSEKLITVRPLPFSGYIYSAEISTDTNYFSNQHLKAGLGLDQEIRLDVN